MCPMGMLKSPTWRRVVELYIATTISPSIDWQALTAWTHDALIELRVAVRAEEDRQAKERSSRNSTSAGRSGPVWPVGGAKSR